MIVFTHIKQQQICFFNIIAKIYKTPEEWPMKKTTQ